MPLNNSDTMTGRKVRWANYANQSTEGVKEQTGADAVPTIAAGVALVVLFVSTLLFRKRLGEFVRPFTAKSKKYAVTPYSVEPVKPKPDVISPEASEDPSEKSKATERSTGYIFTPEASAPAPSRPATTSRPSSAEQLADDLLLEALSLPGSADGPREPQADFKQTRISKIKRADGSEEPKQDASLPVEALAWAEELRQKTKRRASESRRKTGSLFERAGSLDPTPELPTIEADAEHEASRQPTAMQLLEDASIADAPGGKTDELLDELGEAGDMKRATSPSQTPTQPNLPTTPDDGVRWGFVRAENLPDHETVRDIRTPGEVLADDLLLEAMGMGEGLEPTFVGDEIPDANRAPDQERTPGDVLADDLLLEAMEQEDEPVL